MTGSPSPYITSISLFLKYYLYRTTSLAQGNQPRQRPNLSRLSAIDKSSSIGDITTDRATTTTTKMLQAISNTHDSHVLRTSSTSAANVQSSRSDAKLHLLIAASGSVATIKLPNIINALSRHQNLSIRVILTSSATHFLAGQSSEQPTVSALSHLPNVDAVYTDSAEWTPAWKRNAPILHIELRKWAHLLVIAPLSANTLAKITSGICDNLLLSVVRAWDTTGTVDADGKLRKKILVAPAMNTAMWKHPITARQIRVLEEEWGGEEGWFEVLHPIEKTLACKDVGTGAMMEWTMIVEVIEESLGLAYQGANGEA
jgi:phosphopantothenoylcysteine decarboxylase